MVRDAGYRRILYRMGYYEYQQGLVFRHLNQEGGWDQHLGNCRDFILRSVMSRQPAILTVLGSGWLLDLPLGELAAITQKIYLVDIIHPPMIREKIESFDNIELKEEDVTGGLIKEVWEKCHGTSVFRKKTHKQDIRVPDYEPACDQGMVVSLNLLTQLEALPCRVMERHALMSHNDITAMKREIQQSHLSFLQKHDSVLITDTCEVEIDSGGRTKTIPSLLVPLPQGKINSEWEWNFDNEKSDYYLKKSIFMVSARCYINEQG